RQEQIRLRKPTVYQEASGVRREIACRYLLRDNDTIGFQVDAYDTASPLVIDPVLVYSTYLGGGRDDFGSAIAVDGDGHAYVTGETTSTDFPTTPEAFQTTYGGLLDAFVTKLNREGSTLVYSTYLGGRDFDSGRGIAV